MMTITPDGPVTPRRGWVLYDGDCSLCLGMVDRFAGTLRRRGFDLNPLQAPWVVERLALPPDRLLEEMKVLTAGGEVIGGAEAVLYLSRAIWWAWPLYAVGRIPVMKPVLRRAYRWVAERRHCAGGVCQVPAAPGHDEGKEKGVWSGG